MSDIDVKALREVLAKMSERPWTVCAEVPMPGLAVVACTGNAGPDTWIANSGHRSNDEDDARGIVAIVNAAESLLSRIAALEEGLREACDVLASAWAIIGTECDLDPDDDAEERERITRLRALAGASGAPGEGGK